MKSALCSLPGAGTAAAPARPAFILLGILLIISELLAPFASFAQASGSSAGSQLLAQADAAFGQPDGLTGTARRPALSRLQAGRVLDERGRPLSGATVMLQGSQQIVSTDGSGNFVLEVPSGDYNFVFSFAGYSDEAVAGRNGPLTITLVPDLSKKKQFHYHHRHGRLVGSL